MPGEEQAIVKAIQNEAADLAIRSVAKVRAKARAYEKISGNFESFIHLVAERLVTGKYERVSQEVSMGRLVAQWLLETRLWLEENEELIQGVERVVQKDYVKDSLEALPEDIRLKVMEEIEEKRLEAVEWLVRRLALASKEAKEEVITV